MDVLHIVLKNGKIVRSEKAPFIQVMHWFIRLRDHKKESFSLPTSEGTTFKISGDWVHNMAIDKDDYDINEAAVAMMLEPCTHYMCNGKLFQFSDLSKSYEMATVRQGVINWRPCVLIEGLYIRQGQNSCINPNMLVSANT